MSAAARIGRRRVAAIALAVVLALAAGAAAMLQWPPGRVASAPRAPLATAPRAAPSAPAQPPAGAAAARIEVERFEQRRHAPGEAATVRDAFAAPTWGVAASPAAGVRASPAAAAQPTAPPWPFEVLGRYEDGRGPSVVLLRGDRVYIAVPGQVIEETWRIERVGPGELEVTYLPLRAKQTMSTGEGS